MTLLAQARVENSTVSFRGQLSNSYYGTSGYTFKIRHKNYLVKFYSV